MKTSIIFEIIFAMMISTVLSAAFSPSIVSRSNSRSTVIEHARIEERRITRKSI
ncbi:MAG: hypothetical protein RMH75_01320 [Archaeoglobaceae archaeon]|nr:hypothetical protein [Archaeoglobaceae archaeon]MDW7989300.1 hypothetical protein [Archaeoglobaceae archaeon]